MDSQRIKACRVCGNTELADSIDIGAQYLSSIFPENTAYRDELKPFPLEIVQCIKTGEGQCGSLQLAYDCDISEMYTHYPYTSGSNSSMRAILGDVAASGRALVALKADDVVLDIGCNDGTLLANFQVDPVDLVGIDPASNVESTKVESARFTRVKDFFSAKAFDRVSKKKARLVFSVAMFYHLSDPVAFCRDIASVLADDGVVVIQMAYLPAMIRTNMYDNIVHEHVGYYGTQHMKWIFERAGLELFDVTLNDVYGGSFRVFAKKKGRANPPPTERLQQNLKEELDWGIFEKSTYASFMQRIEKTKADLKAVLAGAKKEGKRVWVYGASTKGNTIMQYCGIGPSDVDAAADSNAFKIGKHLIGSDIPIRSEEDLRKTAPDYLLALPYSFVDAFRQREKALVERGTKFIVPLPDVQVV